MPRNTSGLRRGGGRTGPNKATREIKAITQQLFDDTYFEKVRARLINGKLAPAVECKLLAYAFGEPKQQHEISGPDGGPIREIIHKYVVPPPSAADAPAR